MQLTAHTKHVIIACVIAVVVLLSVFKIQAHFDGVAHDNRVLADQQLKVSQEKNKTDAAASVEIAKAQVKRDSDNEAEKRRVDFENAKLRADIDSLKKTLQDQQGKDRALPPVELANRIASLAGVTAQDIKVTPDGFEFSLPATQSVVQLLDELVSTRQTVVSQNSIIANDESRVQKADADISGLHEQVGQLNERIVNLNGSIKAIKDDWAKQKTDDKNKARKKGFKLFVAGAVTGAVIVIKLVAM